MMQRRYFLLLLTTFFTLSLSAQKWESVKNNPSYICGEGWGSSIQEADKNALNALISKIAVNVSASSASGDKSIIKNGELDETSMFQSTVSTYAQATLTNTEYAILHNEPDAHVGRWIKRTEIDKIFASRIVKVKDMIATAQRAAQKGKIDDALRNYYWALTLTKSLQRPNEATITDSSNRERLIMTWVPEQMNELLEQIKATVTKQDGRTVELLFTYQGKPVNSLDYKYFDGQSWSNIYSAKDGIGLLELSPGSNNKSVQLKYEFEYRGQARIDPELESVLNVVRSTPIRKAYTDVALKTSRSTISSTATFTSTKKTELAAPKALEQCKIHKDIVNRVVAAIQHKQYTNVKDLFTPEGFDVYQRIIQYGNARLVGTPNWQFYQNGEYTIGRGVQMAFSFKSGVRKSFVEDVVFTFNSEKKISNIAFGLGNTAIDDILNKGVWSESARIAIMNFLENYKTAYGLKRLDYIRSIFDDNAIIIVGNVVRTATLNHNRETGVATINNNTIIQKNRYTKDQYLKNLEQCFKSNEYINIRFANNDVIKLKKGGEIYAIQIAQDYYSSNYGDKGYLFLMVDINNPEQPIIKVRTWQTEKDPNFGLYGPGDF